MITYRIRALDAAINATDFRCGHDALDDYIRRCATQDVRRNVARVFVATPESDARKLAGYFTLSAGSVACSDLPAELARKLPRYPVPVALLRRLAVDTACQGTGLGSILVADAATRVARASSTLAVAGIVVDAKDEAAASFHTHFGFVALPGQRKRLLLPARLLPAPI